MRDDIESGTTPMTRWAGITATCSSRTTNEDAFAVYSSRETFVVADGCGSFGSGRRAAEITVSCFGETGGSATHLMEPRPSSPYRTPPRRQELLGPPADSLAQAVVLANQLVLADAERNQKYRGLGCALAALRLQEGWLTTAHVGDCRIGRLREGQLTWLTDDHTLWLEMQRSGADNGEVERIKQHYSTVITRSIGTAEPLDVDIQYRRLVPGDLYLLCSDGLWRYVSVNTIRETLSEPNRLLATQCRTLLHDAEKAGGCDNTTLLLVELR